MMKKLASGMWCIVLPGGAPAEFTGSAVKLIRFVPAMTPINDRPQYHDGRLFQLSQAAWEVESEDLEGHVEPKYLMPISGEGSPDMLRYTKEISNA